MDEEKLNDNELNQVNGGFIPPIPIGVVLKDEQVFQGTIDGNGKTVHLSIGPEEYDCSGLIS